MKFFKKILATLTVVLTVLGFGQLAKADVNGTPKELTDVISNVIIWDTSNGREATQKDGSYSLIKDANYSFETSFDLTAYDNDLNNGDHFSFTIPAPFTIVDGTTLTLIDQETGLNIGQVVLASAGENAGGSAEVVLNNLDAYLATKGGTEVTNVRGRFYIQFSVKELQNATPTNFPDVKGGKAFNITVEERKETDNSGAVGIENIAKYGGVIAEQNWTSAILNQSGNHWHKWRVRLNASGKTYNQLTLHDKVSEVGAPMQYLPDPEFLVVTAGDGIDQGWQLTNPQTLVAGQDYTVTYNSSYTAFDLVIHNPGNRRFMVDYSTTAPADGSTVANTVSITSNGQAIEWADGRGTTEMTVERLSKIQIGATISIDTARRITIFKVDQISRQPLAGAVFKITKPDGTSVTLPPTDAKGRTQSEAFTEDEIAAGTFTIEEITAPAGYELDPTPRTVTVTKDGVVRQIPNTPSPTPNTPTPNTPTPNTPTPNTPAPNAVAPVRPDNNNLDLDINKSKVDANTTGANNATPNTNSNTKEDDDSKGTGNSSQTKKILPATGEKTSMMAILGLVTLTLVLVIFNKKSKKDA